MMVMITLSLSFPCHPHRWLGDHDHHTHVVYHLLLHSSFTVSHSLSVASIRSEGDERMRRGRVMVEMNLSLAHGPLSLILYHLRRAAVRTVHLRRRVGNGSRMTTVTTSFYISLISWTRHSASIPSLSFLSPSLLCHLRLHLRERLRNEVT